MSIKATIRASLLLVSILLLLSPSVLAQVSDKEKAEKELERKQQLERKTYALVEEIASGAPGLKLPENRWFVLASAADLLWEHDEPRARNIFWDALNTLTLLANPINNKAVGGDEKAAKPSAKEKDQSQSLYFAVFAMRQELLRRVAKHDPQLALDMLRSSRQPPLDSPNANFHAPDDRALEQQIAAEATARDPQKALQLARDSLAKGLSFELFNLLWRLNQKDAELGSKFAGDIIEKLSTRNLATDLDGGRIAVTLLDFSRTPRNISAEKTQAPKAPQLKLEREQRRALVEMLTNAALTGSANGNLLFAIDDVMPEIQEFAPERIPLLERKLAAFNQTLNKAQKVSQEYNAIARSGTPEDMIKFAGRAGEGDRESMEQQAVVMAVVRGRGDALREFVNTEIEDAGRRRSLLDTLDTEQIDEAVYRGNAEQLRKLLPLVRLKERRAQAMAQMAILLEKKGAHDEALKLLDEAQALIKTDLNSETQTDALLALVAGYAVVEPAKAFSIIERTIDRANDEIAKAVLLDKIAKSGMVKKGEIRLQQTGMPLDLAVFKYGPGVAALANADFDRTKAAADRFERTELRLMARLLLAQALLRGVDEAHDQ